MNMFISKVNLLLSLLMAVVAMTVIEANPPTLPPFIRDHSWNDGFCDIDAVVPTNAISSFYEASTEFTFDLFKAAVLSDKISINDNVAYSPTSIWLALGMLMQGARGTTKTILRERLAPLLNAPLEDYDDDDKDHWMRALYHNIMSDMNQKRSGGGFSATSYKLSSANRLYVRQGFTVAPAFTETLSKCFLAEPQAMDFQANDAAKTINDWVKAQTNNKIENIVNTDLLKTDPALILINAIYFKADWAKPFTTENKALTRKDEFTQGNGEKKEVDFMTMTDTFLYKDYDDMQMLGIPYKDKEVIMFVFLPKNSSNMAELPSRSQLIRKMSEGAEERVSVMLPKFKVEANFPLADALKASGLQQLFTDSADLSGIAGAPTLKVSNAVHKAFIEVNEKGTEAAAATAILISTKMGGGPPSFRADHPFLFAIQHQANIDVFEEGVTSDKDAVKRVSKQILFFGRISSP